MICTEKYSRVHFQVCAILTSVKIQVEMAHSAGGMETALFSLLSSSDPFYDRTPWFKVSSSSIVQHNDRFQANRPWTVPSFPPFEVGATTN